MAFLAQWLLFYTVERYVLVVLPLIAAGWWLLASGIDARGGWRGWRMLAVLLVALWIGPNLFQVAGTIIEACFAETTTLGVRWHLEERVVLARATIATDDDIGVKLAERPGGRTTAKAESDDLAGIAGHAEREEVRRSVEREVLSKRTAEEGET